MRRKTKDAATPGSGGVIGLGADRRNGRSRSVRWRKPTSGPDRPIANATVCNVGSAREAKAVSATTPTGGDAGVAAPIAVTVAALLAVILVSCGSAASKTESGSSANGATAVTPTGSDLAALATAWNHFPFQASRFACQAVILPSTVRMAEDTTTHTTWAIGTVTPGPTCSIPYNGHAGVFLVPEAETGVFQKLSGGAWTMNYYASFPFPCGPAVGDAHGAPVSPVPPTNPPGVTTPTTVVVPNTINVGPTFPPTTPTTAGSGPTPAPPTTIDPPGPGQPTLPVDVLAAMGFQPNPAA